VGTLVSGWREDSGVEGGRKMAEDRGERATGTPNTIYDLSSVLFHALEGGASYDKYIRDAEEAGDEELATFFIEVRDEDSMRAEEAQRLLAERTPAANERGGTSAAMAGGAATGLSPDMEPSTLPPDTPEELPPIREEGPPRTEPISAAPGIGDEPSGRAEEAPPPRPEPRADLPGTEPIAEGAPSGDVRRETAVTRTSEADLIPPGGEVPPTVPRTGELPPERAADEAMPPSTAGIEEGVLPRTEEAPPSRTEEPPVAEEVPSGTPPQAPPGDVQSADRERIGQEEREEDKGLLDRAKDYLRGEDRERDYLRGEDRDRER
jgi:hypothetical protein